MDEWPTVDSCIRAVGEDRKDEKVDIWIDHEGSKEKVEQPNRII